MYVHDAAVTSQGHGKPDGDPDRAPKRRQELPQHQDGIVEQVEPVRALTQPDGGARREHRARLGFAMEDEVGHGRPADERDPWERPPMGS